MRKAGAVLCILILAWMYGCRDEGSQGSSLPLDNSSVTADEENLSSEDITSKSEADLEETKEPTSEVPTTLGQNLLKDENFTLTFSDNTPDNNGKVHTENTWIFFQNNGATGTYEIDQSMVKVIPENVQAPEYGLQLIQAPIAVETGGVYEVSIRAKAERDRTIAIKVGATGDKSWVAYGFENLKLTTELSTYRFQFTSENSDDHARFEIFLAQDQAPVWIESVSLRKYEADDTSQEQASKNLLTGHITIEGRQLLVDDKPFYLQGVCWNPVGKGGRHPADLDFSGFVTRDAQLMQDAGINVVRTYEPITDTSVLDVLYEHGIYVINTVYPYGGNNVTSVLDHVEAVKDHPAILMWCLGNEWNYNGLYIGDTMTQAISKLNEAAALIRTIDTVHPITTVYGHVPSQMTIDKMPAIDVWGLNVYSGLTFGNVFDLWHDRSDKPMFMAEYGADAWNANIDREDLDAQAEATRILTLSLQENSAFSDPDKVCIGGTIFEFADEWWKDNNGQPETQESGGIAPGGGPHPDKTFNEEYWGLVDIDRKPRPAYDALKLIFTGK